MRIYKHGKNFWIDYTVNGKRFRQSTGTSNQKEARQWMEQIDVARRMPTFDAAVDVLKHFFDRPVEGFVSLSAIWQTYERVAKAVGKDKQTPATIRTRRHIVERLIEWLQKHRPTVQTAETITGPIATAYAEHLASLDLKTKSRRNIIGELSAVWNMLANASSRISNPWTHLAPSDTDGKRGQAFTPTQEAAVLKAAKQVGFDWFEICQIMRMTGLRYGDVAALTWSETANGAIRLAPTKTKRHGIRVAIPIIEPLRQILESIPHRGDYIFPLHAELYSRPAARERLGMTFRSVLDAAGISEPGYSVHSWRHTAATRLAAAGVDIETRKRILGHTVNETARRYDHDEHLAETRQALEIAADMKNGRRTQNH